MAKVTCTSVNLTISQGSTSVTTATDYSGGVVVPSGTLVGVASTAGAMDGSDTYTVTITDAYSNQIYTAAALAESVTTVDFYDTSTESFPMSIPCIGPVVITVTASAQQDDADVDYIIYLYIRE